MYEYMQISHSSADVIHDSCEPQRTNESLKDKVSQQYLH